MKPGKKKQLTDLGFKKEVERIDQGKCPLCGNPITEFRDKLSQKEFDISGMCQKCQDRIFKNPD